MNNVRPTALIALFTVALAALTLTHAQTAAAQNIDDKILAVERVLFDIPDSGLEVDITAYEKEWQGGIIRDVYRYQHQDGGAIVTFQVQDEQTNATLLKQLDALLDKVVKDTKTKGKPKRGKVNDMASVFVQGTGTCGESPCKWAARLYQSRPDTVLLAMAYIHDDKAPAHYKTAVQFLASVDLNDEERKAQGIKRRKKKKKKRWKKRR